MAEAKKLYLEDPAPILDEEDEETVAAIDEGIRDADEGRTVPIEGVRKQMHEWITARLHKKSAERSKRQQFTWLTKLVGRTVIEAVRKTEKQIRLTS